MLPASMPLPSASSALEVMLPPLLTVSGMLLATPMLSELAVALLPALMVIMANRLSRPPVLLLVERALPLARAQSQSMMLAVGPQLAMARAPLSREATDRGKFVVMLLSTMPTLLTSRSRRLLVVPIAKALSRARVVEPVVELLGRPVLPRANLLLVPLRLLRAMTPPMGGMIIIGVLLFRLILVPCCLLGNLGTLLKFLAGKLTPGLIWLLILLSNIKSRLLFVVLFGAAAFLGLVVAVLLIPAGLLLVVTVRRSRLMLASRVRSGAIVLVALMRGVRRVSSRVASRRSSLCLSASLRLPRRRMVIVLVILALSRLLMNIPLFLTNVCWALLSVIVNIRLTIPSMTLTSAVTRKLFVSLIVAGIRRREKCVDGEVAYLMDC